VLYVNMGSLYFGTNASSALHIAYNEIQNPMFFHNCLFNLIPITIKKTKMTPVDRFCLVTVTFTDKCLFYTVLRRIRRNVKERFFERSERRILSTILIKH